METTPMSSEINSIDNSSDSKDDTTFLSHTKARKFKFSQPYWSSVPDEDLSLSDDYISEAEKQPSSSIAKYTIVECGTERGKQKLVSRDGYSFTFKRKQKSGTVEWRCSFRGKSNPCSVTIKQRGDNFYSSGTITHTHPPKPGLLTATQIKSQCKQTGKSNITESARDLVSFIHFQLSDPSQPEAWRPNHQTLIKMVQRVRAKCHPKSFKMTEPDVTVGRRIECDGHRGTICWIGELPSSENTWYGIDWDDPSRGRHDGSHNNIRYFNTRHSTSGSFIRPSKVRCGVTFEQAVRGRYQDDTTIESEVTEQLQREINARFVEVVGMAKIGKKQSKLEELGTAVLTQWMIWGTDEVDLAALFPRLHSVDVSNSLLSSWNAVADIAHQLHSLRFLNVSGNILTIPDHPEEMMKRVSHVIHLVLNKMSVYSWQDILTCCIMFPQLRNLQVAFNNLEVLGPIPCNVFTYLEELDIGENPVSSWEEVCHLGSLERLVSLNANSCHLERITFPFTSVGCKTKLFPKLKNLMLANNPLDTWECTGELNKLAELDYLVISYDVKTSPYFQEFTFARISQLKFLNRTELSVKEKRDCELFYLKTFSSEYYKSGGKEDQDCDSLSEEFKEKHPTYLRLIKAHGAPVDESSFKTQKSQKLKDLKVELQIVVTCEPERKNCWRCFLLTTKIAKVKMMVKRHMKISPSTNIQVSHQSSKDGYEIPLDNDQQDLTFYSVENGDTLLVSW